MFERELTRKETGLIHQIEQFVRKKHRYKKGHDYSHVLAVTDFAIQIAQAIPEKVNPLILIVGALFHDLGQVGTYTTVLHGLRGAALAREYLTATWVSSSDREKILRVVARHTPTTMIPPETVEERIVFDADALDRLGLMGVLRGIMDKKGSTEYILEDRMQRRLRDYDKLHFEASRHMGEMLHQETLEVVSRFRAALDRRAQELMAIPWPVDDDVNVDIPLAMAVTWDTAVQHERAGNQRGTSATLKRTLTQREVELIENLARFTETKHRDAEAHDYAHVLAVVNYAVRIANTISDKVDPFALICGAFFHDIGWIGTMTGSMHGLRGAAIANEYLTSTWVPSDLRRHIKSIIVRHTVTSGLLPETVEEKIVWDADGLAGLGLLGMLRFIINGAGSTEEILEGCLRFAEKHFDRLYFDESRRIGQELHAETEETIRRFNAALAQRKKCITDLSLPIAR